MKESALMATPDSTSIVETRVFSIGTGGDVAHPVGTIDQMGMSMIGTAADLGHLTVGDIGAYRRTCADLLRHSSPVSWVDGSVARQRFASILQQLTDREGTVVITRYGKPVGALLAHRTYSQLTRLLYRIADSEAPRQYVDSGEPLDDDLVAAVREA